ncbi:transposase domain-containing protein [Streptomyces sp. NPDC002853]
MDAVLAETRTVQRRLRDLPSRVGVYFLLAMCLFPEAGYRLAYRRRSNTPHTARLVPESAQSPPDAARPASRRRPSSRPSPPFHGDGTPAGHRPFHRSSIPSFP